MNYIINLDSRPDRWEKMEKQLKEQVIDLNIQRFSAIRPKWENLEDYVKRMEASFLIKLVEGHCSYGLGTIGVFLSQETLWKKCIENDKPMLIFEDDVYFQTNEFQKELNIILKDLENDFDIIVFFPNMKIPRITKRTQTVIQTETPLFGAYAYYLHPNFAKQLQTELQTMKKPFDVQVKNYVKDKKHKCYLSQKYLITTPIKMSRDSNIVQQRPRHFDTRETIQYTNDYTKCKNTPFIFSKYRPNFNVRTTFDNNHCSVIKFLYNGTIIFHLEHSKTLSNERFECNLEEKQFKILFSIE